MDKTEAALIVNLVEKIASRGSALEEGRIDEANLLFDQMASLSRTLLAMCNSVPTVILPYLESQNPHVLKWFAFLALEFEPAAGERVLEELAAEFI